MVKAFNWPGKMRCGGFRACVCWGGTRWLLEAASPALVSKHLRLNMHTRAHVYTHTHSGRDEIQSSACVCARAHTLIFNVREKNHAETNFLCYSFFALVLVLFHRRAFF